MQTEVMPYVANLKDSVKREIALHLSAQNAKRVAEAAFAFHFGDGESLSFQKYYRGITGHQDEFLGADGFFRTFKYRYSLQGIDGGYLDRLEKDKARILQLLNTDRIAELYFTYFASAPIKHGEGIQKKNLGSFFAKLVHTFKPETYCALDNPIKDKLGLKNESFFIAFIVVSAAYSEWARENQDLVRVIRAELERNPVGQPFSDNMTDLKLLDLVFWHLANRGE